MLQNLTSLFIHFLNVKKNVLWDSIDHWDTFSFEAIRSKIIFGSTSAADIYRIMSFRNYVVCDLLYSLPMFLSHFLRILQACSMLSINDSSHWKLQLILINHNKDFYWSKFSRTTYVKFTKKLWTSELRNYGRLANDFFSSGSRTLKIHRGIQMCRGESCAPMKNINWMVLVGFGGEN